MSGTRPAVAGVPERIEGHILAGGSHGAVEQYALFGVYTFSLKKGDESICLSRRKEEVLRQGTHRLPQCGAFRAMPKML